MPVTLKTFTETTEVSALQKKMKEAISKAAGQGSVRYVAAKDYKLGDKKVNLFLVVDKPTDFLNLIKKQSGIKFAEGEAEVTKDTDNKHKVVVSTARGGWPAEAVSTGIKLATGNDSNFVATTSDRIVSNASAMTDRVAQIVQASHNQARLEGKIDYEIEFTKDMVTNMAKATFETAEYKKFKGNFEAFTQDIGLIDGDVGKLPVKIWGKLMQGLIKSGYVKEVIPKAADGESFILATKGPAGKPIREQMLKQAMEGLQPFVEHASRYLDKVIVRANTGATWAFWSGAGAEDAAKAAPGVSLEGSVGSMFAKYEGEWINLPKLTGVADLALWAAMSEMYAKKAAESMSKFKFIGFVGPGATREQNVFNQIEQPTFVEVLESKATVPAPKIDWFVVVRQWEPAETGRATFKGVKGNWTEPHPPQAHLPFSDRESALAKIRELYEM